jgi:hypothetical protein
MLQHALPLTVLQYRRDRLLVQRVRTLLQQPSGAALTAAALARASNTSLRSLHRHLHQEGASVQALKDEGLPVLEPFLNASVKVRESHEAARPLVFLDPGHKLSQAFVGLHAALSAAPRSASRRRRSA